MPLKGVFFDEMGQNCKFERRQQPLHRKAMCTFFNQ